jgi:hypothetical protein
VFVPIGGPCLGRGEYLIHIENMRSNSVNGYRLVCDLGEATEQLFDSVVETALREFKPELFATPLRGLMPIHRRSFAFDHTLMLDESWRRGLPALKAMLDDCALAQRQLRLRRNAQYVRVRCRRALPEACLFARLRQDHVDKILEHMCLTEPCGFFYNLGARQ